MAGRTESPDGCGGREPSVDDADANTLPPAARRALAEAEARRRSAAESEPGIEKELGGRKDGPEPTRYGDWEKKGILSDF